MKEYSDDVEVRAAHAIYMKGDTVKIPFIWKNHPLFADEPQVSYLRSSYNLYH